MSDIQIKKSILIAIAWCLAWGDNRQPQFKRTVLQQMLKALRTDNPEKISSDVGYLVEQVQTLQDLEEKDFPENLVGLKKQHPDLWNQTTPIGLVYGGATKIKQYVFEAAKLSDIRGASALLDRINLSDIPGFFKHPDGSQEAAQWLGKHFPGFG